MDHLIEFGIKGFRSEITVFPAWAAYVLSQCRKEGFSQTVALIVLKENYAMILANPDAFGIPANSIKRESSLPEVRRFDLNSLPVVDKGLLDEMIDVLLDHCVDEGRTQELTLVDAQKCLLKWFPSEFHRQVNNSIKSVYAALKYYPGSQLYFSSSAAEIDAFNPFAHTILLPLMKG